MSAQGETNKVSVVIPTYNRRHLIGQTLESVYAQTYPPHEIIVVDDGSSDGTVEFLRQHGDRLRVIVQKNQGPSAARNHGMAEATGDFIAFLDSDDLWVPEKTARQIEFFDQHPHLELTFGDVAVYRNGRQEGNEIVDRDLRRFLARNASDLVGIFRFLITHNFTITSTLLLRKSCAEAVGRFDVGLRQCEDLDYWLRAARDHRFGFVDGVLALRRRHEDNLVNDWYKRETAHVLVLSRLFQSRFRLTPDEQQLAETRLDELTYDLGSYHFKRCEFAEAHEWFKRSPITERRSGKRFLKEAASSALSNFLRQNFRKPNAAVPVSQPQE